jgi:peroxiredoxin (alkyl hydroperoxide reductase subunit C)
MNEFNLSKPLSIGDDVPNFEMETYDPSTCLFGKVSLSDLRSRGKWSILVFYPADFSFVCPTELADLAGVHARLDEMGCEIVAVSTDTKYAHLAWRNSERLLENVAYAMAADPTGAVSRLFGVYDESSGAALRGTFVINPEGKLVSSEVLFYNVGRDAQELVRKMEANVHLMAHPNEACPAHWKPGQTTLQPSEELVGNVYDALHAAD